MEDELVDWPTSGRRMQSITNSYQSTFTAASILSNVPTSRGCVHNVPNPNTGPLDMGENFRASSTDSGFSHRCEEPLVPWLCDWEFLLIITWTPAGRQVCSMTGTGEMSPEHEAQVRSDQDAGDCMLPAETCRSGSVSELR